jgi:hypothetical protein
MQRSGPRRRAVPGSRAIERRRNRVKIGTTRETIEADLYEAEMIEWTDTDQDGSPILSRLFNPDDEQKPQYVVTFELVDVEDRTLRAWINKPQDPNFVSPRAKLVQLVLALWPDVGDADWTMDDLLHKRCRLQVETYEKSDGSTANKITRFLPLKKGAATKPAAAERVPTVAERKREAVAAGAGKALPLDPDQVPF